MPPTPPPIVINNLPTPASGAPWWAPYLLAGLFVLVGATIGLLSTKLSDKRKQAGDDLRQWDKEIRTLYLEAMEHYKGLDGGRFENTPSKLSGRYYAEAEVHAKAFESIAQSLEVIAEPATVAAAKEMTSATEAIKDSLNLGLKDWPAYERVDEAQKALLLAVKGNLRIGRLSLMAKCRMWADGQLAYWNRRRTLQKLLKKRRLRQSAAAIPSSQEAELANK